MRTMYDAAFPPALPPATDAVAFYIGGDTPHTWFPTPQQDRRWRCPIYVMSFPMDPAKVADAITAWARLNGMPFNGCYMLDVETLNDPLDADIILMRCPLPQLLYTSRVNELDYRSDPRRFRMVATLDGRDVMYSSADATQWVDTGAVDLTIVGDQVPLWDTQAPTPQPNGGGSWESLTLVR